MLNLGPVQLTAEAGAGRPGPTGQGETDAVGHLISVALAQIDAQLGDSDSHDVKALGLIASILAGSGLLALTKGPWSNAWLPAAILATLSCGCFLFTVLGRQFNIGPDLPALYAAVTDMARAEANRQILAELQKAIRENGEVLVPKARWFVVGVVLMAASVISVGTVLYLVG